MKKLIVLMIAISFCIIGSGVALGDEPVPAALDRHAVWTKWFDERGDRFMNDNGEMNLTPGVERKISSETLDKMNGEGKPGEFDFIQETKSYDYEKDQEDSA